jgi:hypothetical protein
MVITAASITGGICKPAPSLERHLLCRPAEAPRSGGTECRISRSHSVWEVTPRAVNRLHSIPEPRVRRGSVLLGWEYEAAGLAGRRQGVAAGIDGVHDPWLFGCSGWAITVQPQPGSRSRTTCIGAKAADGKVAEARLVRAALSVGEVAARSGLAVSAIQFYEKQTCMRWCSRR